MHMLIKSNVLTETSENIMTDVTKRYFMNGKLVMAQCTTKDNVSYRYSYAHEDLPNTCDIDDVINKVTWKCIGISRDKLVGIIKTKDYVVMAMEDCAFIVIDGNSWTQAILERDEHNLGDLSFIKHHENNIIMCAFDNLKMGIFEVNMTEHHPKLIKIVDLGATVIPIVVATEKKDP